MSFVHFRELNLTSITQLDNRPPLEEVSRVFKDAKYLANVAALVMTVVLVLIWPAGMIAVGTMTLEDFTNWVSDCVSAWSETQDHIGRVRLQL